MSTLLIDELDSGVTLIQPIRISKSINVAFIRPWIYKEGTLVDGDFQLEVYDGATLLKSASINFATINSLFTQPYAHGYIRFDFEGLALNVGSQEENHIYTLKFKMLNHTTSVVNYIALVREWDVRKYELYTGEPGYDTTEPFGLEIYTYRS